MQAHVPSRLMRSSKAKKISLDILPQPEDAVRQYRQSGGQITDPGQTITDPLQNNDLKMNIRSLSFTKKYPSFETIFHSTVNGNEDIFIDALLFFIDMNYRLSRSE